MKDNIKELLNESTVLEDKIQIILKNINDQFAELSEAKKEIQEIKEKISLIEEKIKQGEKDIISKLDDISKNNEKEPLKVIPVKVNNKEPLKVVKIPVKTTEKTNDNLEQEKLKLYSEKDRLTGELSNIDKKIYSLKSGMQQDENTKQVMLKLYEEKGRLTGELSNIDKKISLLENGMQQDEKYKKEESKDLDADVAAIPDNPEVSNEEPKIEQKNEKSEELKDLDADVAAIPDNPETSNEAEQQAPDQDLDPEEAKKPVLIKNIQNWCDNNKKIISQAMLVAGVLVAVTLTGGLALGTMSALGVTVGEAAATYVAGKSAFGKGK